MVEEVTNKQLQFITWLITTATDKCQTIDEVRSWKRAMWSDWQMRSFLLRKKKLCKSKWMWYTMLTKKA